jgi:hypothetical protein
VQKACSNFVVGWVQGGDSLDRAEQTAQAILHIAQAQDGVDIYWRFISGFGPMGSNPARPRQLGHFMQSVQDRINTGDCTSR